MLKKASQPSEDSHKKQSEPKKLLEEVNLIPGWGGDHFEITQMVGKGYIYHLHHMTHREKAMKRERGKNKERKREKELYI